MKKITLFIVSTLISLFLGFIIYFILFILFAIFGNNTNHHPEHGYMPLGEAICAVFPTILISLFILYKIYKWFVKKYK